MIELASYLAALSGWFGVSTLKHHKLVGAAFLLACVSLCVVVVKFS